MTCSRLERARLTAHAVQLLRCPVVDAHEVPGLVACIADLPDLAWHKTEREIRGGWVYLGRGRDREIKIGHSVSPGYRTNEQELDPLLLICDAGRRHERELHILFRRERRHGEYFRGPKIWEFVRCARASSRTKFSAFGWAGVWKERVSKIEWLVTGSERAPKASAA